MLPIPSLTFKSHSFVWMRRWSKCVWLIFGNVRTFSLISLNFCFASHRPPKTEAGLWNGQSSSSLVAGLNPQQCYQPAQGSYQLQFAIQKLQQQRRHAQQLLEQSHCRHQVWWRFWFGSSHDSVRNIGITTALCNCCYIRRHHCLHR